MEKGNGARARTADFDYALPPDLIAQRPAEPRDAARALARALDCA